MARTQRALNAIESPTCLKCGAGMRAILIEEEYPGYERRTFGCQSCDGTMTEWAPAPIQAPARDCLTGCHSRFAEIRPRIMS